MYYYLEINSKKLPLLLVSDIESEVCYANTDYQDIDNSNKDAYSKDIDTYLTAEMKKELGFPDSISSESSVNQKTSTFVRLFQGDFNMISGLIYIVNVYITNKKDAMTFRVLSNSADWRNRLAGLKLNEALAHYDAFNHIYNADEIKKADILRDNRSIYYHCCNDKDNRIDFYDNKLTWQPGDWICYHFHNAIPIDGSISQWQPGDSSKIYYSTENKQYYWYDGANWNYVPLYHEIHDIETPNTGYLSAFQTTDGTGISVDMPDIYAFKPLQLSVNLIGQNGWAKIQTKVPHDVQEGDNVALVGMIHSNPTFWKCLERIDEYNFIINKTEGGGGGYTEKILLENTTLPYHYPLLNIGELTDTEIEQTLGLPIVKTEYRTLAFRPKMVMLDLFASLGYKVNSDYINSLSFSHKHETSNPMVYGDDLLNTLRCKAMSAEYSLYDVLYFTLNPFVFVLNFGYCDPTKLIPDHYTGTTGEYHTDLLKNSNLDPTTGEFTIATAIGYTVSLKLHLVTGLYVDGITPWPWQGGWPAITWEYTKEHTNTLGVNSDFWNDWTDAHLNVFIGNPPVTVPYYDVVTKQQVGTWTFNPTDIWIIIYDSQMRAIAMREVSPTEFGSDQSLPNLKKLTYLQNGQYVNYYYSDTSICFKKWPALNTTFRVAREHQEYGVYAPLWMSLQLWRRRNGTDTMIEELMISQQERQADIQLEVSFKKYVMQMGDVLYTKIDFKGFASEQVSCHLDYKNSSITFEPSKYLTDGEVVNVLDWLPDEYALDWIKKYQVENNLQFNTMPEDRLVEIEPFDQYYLEETIDYSHKTDYNEKITKTELSDQIALEVQFTQVEDSEDETIKNLVLGNISNFSLFQILNPNLFITDSTTFDSQFSAVSAAYFDKIGLTASKIPTINKALSGGSEPPIYKEIKSRLLHWCGIVETALYGAVMEWWIFQSEIGKEIYVDASTNEIRVTSGFKFVDGMKIVVIGNGYHSPAYTPDPQQSTLYYAINSHGSFCQLATTLSGSPITFGGDGFGSINIASNVIPLSLYMSEEAGYNNSLLWPDLLDAAGTSLLNRGKYQRYYYNSINRFFYGRLIEMNSFLKNLDIHKLQYDQGYRKRYIIDLGKEKIRATINTFTFTNEKRSSLCEFIEDTDRYLNEDVMNDFRGIGYSSGILLTFRYRKIERGVGNMYLYKGGVLYETIDIQAQHSTGGGQSTGETTFEHQQETGSCMFNTVVAIIPKNAMTADIYYLLADKGVFIGEYGEVNKEIIDTNLLAFTI